MSHNRPTPLDTWRTKNGRNKSSENARSSFVFAKVLVSLSFSITFHQLPWQFKYSRTEFLAFVFFSKVSCFIKTFSADSRSTKVKILSSWIIEFVPIAKVFGNGDLGFVEYISENFSWSQFDFNWLPLNLWLSKFGVVWNDNWRIRNDFGWFWVSFHITINLSYTSNKKRENLNFHGTEFSKSGFLSNFVENPDNYST